MFCLLGDAHTCKACGAPTIGDDIVTYNKLLKIGCCLRTPSLKTEKLSRKKSVVLVTRENGFTKTLFSLFFQGFFFQGMVLKNPFLRFTRTTDCFTKILGFKGRDS